MIVDRIDRRTVRSAVELAARAPSVHNSQPWRWRIGDRTVHLHADLRRWLPVTDADGRDLLLSLGAVLHHLRVALAASGLHATVHRFPNPDALDHVAAVELRPRVPTEADLGFASAIVARRSDRRGYSDWEVPPALVGELIDRAAEQGATLRPMTPHSLATTRRPSSGPVAPLPTTAFRRRTCCGTSRAAGWTGRSRPARSSATPDSPTAASSRCWAPPPTTASRSCARARRSAPSSCTRHGPGWPRVR